MAHSFFDFEEEINNWRTKITEEVCNLMRGQADIDCKGWAVGITNGDGNVEVSTIYHTTLDDSVQVKTCHGTVTDFSNLSTDDMVALYSFIFARTISDK